MMLQRLVNTSIFLGLMQAVLWAIQHPTQSPLYLGSAGDMWRLLEIVLIAEVASLFLFATLLLFSQVREGVRGLISIPGVLWKMCALAVMSFLSVFLYAFAQSKLNDILVAVVIAASPAYPLVFSSLMENRDKSRRVRIGMALRSKDFMLHLTLAIVVFFCTIFGGIDVLESGYSILSFLGLLLVPAMYFGSYYLVRIWFGDDHSEDIPILSRKVHLAAICLTSVFSALFVGGAVYFCLSFFGNGLSSNYPPERVKLFLFGALVASFGGGLWQHLIHTRSEAVRRRTFVFYHTVPFFTLIAAVIMRLVFSFVDMPLNWWHSASAIIVVFAYFHFYNEGFWTRRLLRNFAIRYFRR